MRRVPRIERAVGIGTLARIFASVVDIPSRREPITLTDDASVLQSSLFDVRLYVELPTLHEQSLDLCEEDVIHDEPLLMPLLPPGIGEVEEHAPHAAVRPHPWQRDARIFAEHTRARSGADLRQTTIADGRPLTTDLETNQRRARSRLRALEEKAGLWAWSDLELDPIARRKGVKMDAPPFGKARRMRVRSCTPNDRVARHHSILTVSVPD